MKYLFFIISILTILSCSESIIDDSKTIEDDIIQYHVSNINGFDLALNTEDYLTFTGKVGLNDNYLDASIRIDEEYREAMDFTIDRYLNVPILRSFNSIANKEMFYHDIQSENGELHVILSETKEGERFKIDIKDKSLSTLSYNDILNYYGNEVQARLCVPCVMAGIAAGTAIACGIANVIDSNNCTSAFEAACGDGGQCCSMEYEGGTCGNGDCNITCN